MVDGVMGLRLPAVPVQQRVERFIRSYGSYATDNLTSPQVVGGLLAVRSGNKNKRLA